MMAEDDKYKIVSESPVSPGLPSPASISGFTLAPTRRMMFQLYLTAAGHTVITRFRPPGVLAVISQSARPPGFHWRHVVLCNLVYIFPHGMRVADNT